MPIIRIIRGMVQRELREVSNLEGIEWRTFFYYEMRTLKDKIVDEF